MTNEPENFPELTAMAEAAAGLHEIYTSLIAAGFDENQALRILAYGLFGRGSQS